MQAPNHPPHDGSQHNGSQRAEPDGEDRLASSELEPSRSQTPPPRLASLTQRAAGAMLDNMLMGIPLLLISLRDRPAEIGTLPTNLLTVAMTLLIIQGSINFFLLLERGQTLGKLATKSRIVLTDGSRAGFFRIIWRRGLIHHLLGFGMPIYLLLDSLLIFRANRRCIHDYIAGTIVVQA